MQDQRYYIRVQGKVMGPFDPEQLRSLRDRGQFRRFHEVSEDRTNWQTAWCLTNVFPAGAAAEKPAAAPSPATLGSSVPVAGFAIAAPIDNRPAGSGAGRPVAEWYYLDDTDKRQGPVSQDKLLMLLQSGAIDGSTPVWKSGMADWIELRSPATGIVVPVAKLVSAKKRRQRTPKGMAVAALILSLLWIGGIGSLLGILLGILALRQIYRAGGRGQGIALAAVAVGLVYLVMTPVLIFLYFKSSVINAPK